MYAKELEELGKYVGAGFAAGIADAIGVSYRSNNWLKMHGYPMRRKAMSKKERMAAVRKFYLSDKWRAMVRRFGVPPYEKKRVD